DVAEADVVRFMNLFHDVVVPNLKSPRNVIRLAGTLRVTSPAGKGEVDAGEVMSIESLRLCWAAGYRNVRERAAKRCDGISRNDRVGAEERRVVGENAFLSGVDEADRPYVRGALQRLFPRLENVWSNVNYPSEWDDKWALARLVCSRQHFPTYFQYAVNQDA